MLTIALLPALPAVACSTLHHHLAAAAAAVAPLLPRLRCYSPHIALFHQLLCAPYCGEPSAIPSEPPFPRSSAPSALRP